MLHAGSRRGQGALADDGSMFMVVDRRLARRRRRRCRAPGRAGKPVVARCTRVVTKARTPFRPTRSVALVVVRDGEATRSESVGGLEIGYAVSLRRCPCAFFLCVVDGLAGCSLGESRGGRGTFVAVAVAVVVLGSRCRIA